MSASNHSDSIPSSSLVHPLAMRHVFVYGTLRRGQSNDIARIALVAGADQAPVLVGFATINGTMFDLGSYPGVVLGSGSPIMGEVYRVTPDVETHLDFLEELLPEPTGEYVKRDIAVQLAASPDGTAVSGPAIDCFVYETIPIESSEGLKSKEGTGRNTLHGERAPRKFHRQTLVFAI